VDTDTTATADTAVASTGTIEKDSKLGLKGGFGTLVMGR
jgi:PDZ domain-containing secreted protein